MDAIFGGPKINANPVVVSAGAARRSNAAAMASAGAAATSNTPSSTQQYDGFDAIDVFELLREVKGKKWFFFF